MKTEPTGIPFPGQRESGEKLMLIDMRLTRLRRYWKSEYSIELQFEN